MSAGVEIPARPEAAPAGDVGRRYVKAALHTGFGGVASRIFGGLAPIILARYLGPKEFGVYTLVLSLVGIVAGVSHLGQNVALQKFLPEYFAKDPRRGGAILADTIVLVSGLLAIVCMAFFFLSGWIASAIYHVASLKPVFQFSALLVLAMSLFNLASSVVAGLQDFKAYSKAMVVRSGAFLLLGWVGVLLFGLYGALAGQLFAALLALALLAFAGLRGARSRLPGVVRTVFSRSVLVEIFSFAFPAFLSGMLVAPAYWWANTLLARDSGFAQVGLFGVAFALAQLIMVIPSNLSIPAVSFMSETYESSDPRDFSRLVGTNLRIVWALTLPIALGCALFAPWVVRVAFGHAYEGATTLASGMGFVALLMVVDGVIGNSIAGSGKMWHGFALNGFWALVFFASSAALIPRWGAAGLAATFGISYIVLTLSVSWYGHAVLRITYEKLGVLSGLTCASVVLATLGLLLGNGSGGLVFKVLLVLAILWVELRWVLDEGDRVYLRGVFSWI